MDNGSTEAEHEMKKCNSCRCYFNNESFTDESGKIMKSCQRCRDRSRKRFNNLTSKIDILTADLKISRAKSKPKSLIERSTTYKDMIENPVFTRNDLVNYLNKSKYDPNDAKDLFDSINKLVSWLREYELQIGVRKL